MVDYLPFLDFTDPDNLKTPDSPLELQTRTLKKAIDITNINFKFLSQQSNILYGELPLTEEIRNIIGITSIDNENKQGEFTVRCMAQQLITTVTWEYMPEHCPNVLRLWITSVKQYSFEADYNTIALDLQQANTLQEKESKKQFNKFNNQDIDKKTAIFEEVIESLKSDEFVNACLNIGTITLMVLAILFPLLNFRDKLNQGRRNEVVPSVNKRLGAVL